MYGDSGGAFFMYHYSGSLQEGGAFSLCINSILSFSMYILSKVFNIMYIKGGGIWMKIRKMKN